MQIVYQNLDEKKLLNVANVEELKALVGDHTFMCNGKILAQDAQFAKDDVVTVKHSLLGAAGSGSLTALSAYGSQNSLTQSASMLPFKCSTTKPAPFSCEPRELTPTGTQNYGKHLTFSVHYSADMFSKCYLVVDINAAAAKYLDGSGASYVEQVEDIGHAMIETLSMEIGAVTHLSVPGEWLHVHETMTVPYSHRSKEFTGRTSDGGGIQSALQALPHSPQRLYIELPFWFNDWCNAVPLVALHLSDIKFKVNLRKKAELYRMVATSGNYSTISGMDTANGTTGGDDQLLVIDNIKAIGEYIFLPDSIRNTLATIEHYQLIKQVQQSTASIPSGVTQFSHQMDFNHMISEIIWYGRRQNFANTGQAAQSHYLQYFNFSGEEKGTAMGTAAGDLFATAQITLNSNERVQAMDPKYFRLVHPRNVSHTNVYKEFIYSYSFALEPERLNPSGTLNASRIENMHLNLKFTSALSDNYDFFVYAINYNVCRISSGVSSISFSS